jgi:hypothetical protein
MLSWCQGFCSQLHGHASNYHWKLASLLGLTPVAGVNVLQVLTNVPPAVGVIVEEGINCFYVKVNCRDRPGLLSDITAAIRQLPLQVCMGFGALLYIWVTCSCLHVTCLGLLLKPLRLVLLS